MVKYGGLLLIQYITLLRLKKMAIKAFNVKFGYSKCALNNTDRQFFKATRRAMTHFQPNLVEKR